jgi:hypothetical protein
MLKQLYLITAIGYRPLLGPSDNAANFNFNFKKSNGCSSQKWLITEENLQLIWLIDTLTFFFAYI